MERRRQTGKGSGGPKRHSSKSSIFFLLHISQTRCWRSWKPRNADWCRQSCKQSLLSLVKGPEKGCTVGQNICRQSLLYCSLKPTLQKTLWPTSTPTGGVREDQGLPSPPGDPKDSGGQQGACIPPVPSSNRAAPLPSQAGLNHKGLMGNLHPQSNNKESLPTDTKEAGWGA